MWTSFKKNYFLILTLARFLEYFEEYFETIKSQNVVTSKH